MQNENSKELIDKMFLNALENSDFGDKYKTVNNRFYELWNQISALLPEENRKMMLEFEDVVVSLSNIEQETLYKKGFEDCRQVMNGLLLK